MRAQMKIDLDVDAAIKRSGAGDWTASLTLQLLRETPDMLIDLGCMTDEAVLQVAHMARELTSGTPAQDAVIDNVFTTNQQFGVPNLVAMLDQAWRPEIMKEVRAYAASH